MGIQNIVHPSLDPMWAPCWHLPLTPTKLNPTLQPMFSLPLISFLPKAVWDGARETFPQMHPHSQGQMTKVRESQVKCFPCTESHLAEFHFTDVTTETEGRTYLFHETDGVYIRPGVPVWLDRQLLERWPSHSSYSI